MNRGILKRINFLVSAMLVLTIMVSCNENEKFERTDSGLKYVKHISNDGPKPKLNDIIYIMAQYRTENDSVFCCAIGRKDSITLSVNPPVYKGSFEEGFTLMSAGDSVTFYLPADSVFQHTFRMPLPSYIEPGGGVFFDVKLLSFETRENYNEKQRIVQEKAIQQEKSMLAAYAAQKNIVVEPNPSGLYFVKKSSGTGPKAENGDKVTMAYTGMLLDGTVFDASDKHPGDFEFTLGVGQVIQGWDEAVSQMRKGDKAYILIPSYMAYGPRGSGKLIPPNSPLAFDIEVLDVKKP